MELGKNWWCGTSDGRARVAAVELTLTVSARFEGYTNRPNEAFDRRAPSLKNKATRQRRRKNMKGSLQRKGGSTPASLLVS
jgi:hypothetical protein